MQHCKSEKNPTGITRQFKKIQHSPNFSQVNRHHHSRLFIIAISSSSISSSSSSVNMREGRASLPTS